MAESRAVSRILAARTYLLRNPRRVIPIALIHALVTALLVAGISPTNVFDTMAEAYIRPLESFTIVSPQLRNSFDGELEAVLEANPNMESHIPAKMLWFETPAILGQLWSPLLALRPDDQEAFLERLNVRLAEGRLPRPGMAGAAIHRDLLRARGLALGDEFGRILDAEDTTPGYFEVVGVLEGESRLGILDFGYASIPDFVLARKPSFRVVYAKPGQKIACDDYFWEQRDAEGRKLFRVLDERWARERSRKTLKNLPLILGFITGADAVIVALVTALISVIVFQARQDEFALFLALGHRRRRLVRKLSTETTLTALAGWVFGLALGIAIVAIYYELLLKPKAIIMDVFDPRPFLYSLSVPILSAIVSAVALAVRLRRMDAVAVIQRRGG